MKKFLAVLFLVAAMTAGCATNGGNTPPTVNQQVVTDITAAAQLIGGGAKAFLPMAGTTGTAISTGIGLFCAIKLSSTATATDEQAYLSQIQGDLQSLWTQFNSFNTQESNEVVLAINAAWTMLSTAVTNAGPNITVAIAYLNAFETGLCNAYNGTLQRRNSTEFWQQYRGSVDQLTRSVAGEK